MRLLLYRISLTLVLLGGPLFGLADYAIADRDTADPPKEKSHDTQQVDLTKAPTLHHQGITILALPPTPGQTPHLPTTNSQAAIEQIRTGYDYLLSHSPYAKKTIALLQATGHIWIFFSPSFPVHNTKQDDGTTFATFNPSLVVQKEGSKSYPVVIGYHLIQWPAEELAWVLGHELVGHGFQHLNNRLQHTRKDDLECEAFLHQERVSQELGLWKNSDLMVRVRQQTEEKWCLRFRQYITQKHKNKMALWNVRNMDIPALLTLYETYYQQQSTSHPP